MASIERGTRVELYNGSGTWGHADGVITAIDSGYHVSFTDRHDGKQWSDWFTKDRWAALIEDGYMKVLEDEKE